MMVENKNDFWQPRTINPLLGKQPKIGAFSYYQIIPCVIFAVILMVVAVEVHQSWPYCLVGWLFLSLAYLVIMGNKPWLTLSRLIAPPDLIVSGIHFRRRK